MTLNHFVGHFIYSYMLCIFQKFNILKGFLHTENYEKYFHNFICFNPTDGLLKVTANQSVNYVFLVCTTLAHFS